MSEFHYSSTQYCRKISMADYSWAFFFSPFCFLECLEKGETLQVQRERARKGEIRFPMCIQMFFHALGTEWRREKVWLQDPGFNTPLSLFFFFSHSVSTNQPNEPRGDNFSTKKSAGKRGCRRPGDYFNARCIRGPGVLSIPLSHQQKPALLLSLWLRRMYTATKEKRAWKGDAPATWLKSTWLRSAGEWWWERHLVLLTKKDAPCDNWDHFLKHQHLWADLTQMWPKINSKPAVLKALLLADWAFLWLRIAGQLQRPLHGSSSPNMHNCTCVCNCRGCCR